MSPDYTRRSSAMRSRLCQVTLLFYLFFLTNFHSFMVFFPPSLPFPSPCNLLI